MKTLFIGVLSIAFALTSYAQKNDWTKLDLKGKVKLVSVINYEAQEKFGKVTKIAILSGEQYAFNENGLVIKKKVYGKGGQPISQIKSLYDEFSNENERIISDEKGVLIKKIINTYNPFNKKVYESIYSSDGSLFSRSKYSYYQDIQEKDIITYDRNGAEIVFQKYTYNKNKGTYNVIIKNPKSKMIEKVLKYDKSDNLIEKLLFDVQEKVVSKIRFVFSEDNNLLESFYYEKGVLIVKRNLIYNNLDFLVKVVEEYPQKKTSDIITYTYDFDERTNWKLVTKYVNSIPISIQERNITYY